MSILRQDLNPPSTFPSLLLVLAALLLLLGAKRIFTSLESSYSSERLYYLDFYY